MATNDYSRRSRKDVFFGDEPQTTAYTPPENSETAEDGADDDLDVEKFIRENDSDITMTVAIKIVTHTLAVGLMLWLWRQWIITFEALYAFGFFFTVIIGSFTIFLITENLFSKSYIKYIEKAVKSFKRIKLYRHEIEGGAAWRDIFTVGPSGSMQTKDLTRIEIDGTIVKALDADLIFFAGKSATHAFYGEYYEIDLGDKAFADNVMIVQGYIAYLKDRPYRISPTQDCTVHAYKEYDIANSDMERVYKLAKILCKDTKNSTILKFKNGKLYFLVRQAPNFEYTLFDYTIKDRLRRDLNVLKNRIKIAEILASA